MNHIKVMQSEVLCYNSKIIICSQDNNLFTLMQVWISYAQFELSTGEDDCMVNCREVYRQANRLLKTAGHKDERLLLLESWKEFEVIKTEVLTFRVVK